MSEQKIIAFDSSFIISLTSNNENVGKVFQQYENDETRKILHDKVIEEYIFTHFDTPDYSLQELKTRILFLEEKNFQLFAVILNNLPILFDKAKELARLGDSLLTKEFIKILDNNQLIQNAKRNLIKELPQYKTLDHYLNQEKIINAEIWKQIFSKSGLKTTISFNGLENIVKNSLTPEVVFKGNNIEKVIYPDPDKEIIYPKSYAVVNEDIWVCERFNIMKPTVSFEHSTFPPTSGSDLWILSPSSNYRQDLQRLKVNYPYLCFSIQRVHFNDLLENIKKSPQNQEKFQITLQYKEEILNLKTKEKTEKMTISIDKNFLPDLKIGLLVPLVDEFLTCDKGQYYLLNFLFPEHAKKIKYIAQT